MNFVNIRDITFKEYGFKRSYGFLLFINIIITPNLALLDELNLLLILSVQQFKNTSNSEN